MYDKRRNLTQFYENILLNIRFIRVEYIYYNNAKLCIHKQQTKCGEIC